MFKKKIIPALLGASVAFSTPAISSENVYEVGLNAYQDERYTEAFKLIRSSAKQGNNKARHLLGTMYQAGVGTRKNEYLAFTWFKKAAEAGHIEAQFQLGLMYLTGQGVTSDDDMALHWVCKASDSGYPQAKETMAYILSNDFGLGC